MCVQSIRRCILPLWAHFNIFHLYNTCLIYALSESEMYGKEITSEPVRDVCEGNNFPQRGCGVSEN